MNQVFDWGRFSRLVSSHFRNNVKTLIISGLVFMGVTAVLFMLVALSQQKSVNASSQSFVHFAVTYGGLLIFTAGIFQAYQRPREGMFQLMLPASGFEKFLAGWVLSFVGYTICANILFFVVRFVVLRYYSGQGYEVSSFQGFDQPLHEDIPMVPMGVMVYLFIHALALYCSLAFRKQAVLKTALTLLLVTWAYRIVNSVLFNAFLQPDTQKQAQLLPLMPVQILKDGVYYNVNIPGWPYWLLALAIAVIGLLWVASYHKLREKEA